jgi:hypothetical protein
MLFNVGFWTATGDQLPVFHHPKVWPPAGKNIRARILLYVS